jgi:hypothetical protein
VYELEKTVVYDSQSNRSQNPIIEDLWRNLHAGIPRLRFIRQRLGALVHFWPFNGWEITDELAVTDTVAPTIGRGDAGGRRDRSHRSGGRWWWPTSSLRWLGVGCAQQDGEVADDYDG